MDTTPLPRWAGGTQFNTDCIWRLYVTSVLISKALFVILLVSFTFHTESKQKSRTDYIVTFRQIIWFMFRLMACLMNCIIWSVSEELFKIIVIRSSQYHFCHVPANGQIIKWHLSKVPCTLSVKLSDFSVSYHTCRENWVNSTVLTGSSTGFRTVISSCLSHRELCISLGESHSFLSLPADTTMAPSQGTSVSSNSFSRWTLHDIFLFKYHFLLRILHFLFFFLDDIMADVASKQQTTALFLSTTVTRTRRPTELTNLIGNLCCAREHSVQFFMQFFFFTQLNCTV